MDYLSFKNAEEIFNLIELSKLNSLKQNLYASAIRYAQIRTDWEFKTIDERSEIDKERTFAHNIFIDSCNILSRNQLKDVEDNNWRIKLGNDRKNIGDFACYISLFLGLRNR